MKRIGVLICLSAGLGGCLFEAPTLVPIVRANERSAHPMQPLGKPQPTQTAIPQPVGPEVQCDVEAKCLAELHGIAHRAGKQLLLKLDNGSTKLFTDTDACETAGESCVQTSFVSHLPLQHLFVLKEDRYEGFNSIIVSSHTGDVFRIADGVPHFSPDRKRFIVVAFDEQNGINQVAVYSTNVFPPAPEWTYVPKSFMDGFEFVAWSGNHKIELRSVDQKSAATITQTLGGWKLVAAGG
ncbi:MULTISPECIES: hypothetical protein [unclassified Bradyrhizobium]|uniref:hypothetical protein n=1 Tax=unclassified Bradyrhizobium TaxID=2631580 RepID=UPI002915EBEB|nr:MULTISPECIES: hypothetical protein [unclassified Bradyrhizobium]